MVRASTYKRQIEGSSPSGPSIFPKQFKSELSMLKINEYFDGNVKSIAFSTTTLPATVGVMQPGNYVFNTNDKETVTVVSGSMQIKRDEDEKPVVFNAGETFHVKANTAFDVSVSLDTAYLCLYG